MHAVIVLFVDAVIYFLKLGAFTATLFSQHTVFAIALTASIGVLGVAFAIGLFAFEKQFGLVAAFFDAFVLL
jgi:hypothetical protein